MEELLPALQKFGLSKKESTTYLATLALGDATANDISLKSELPRTLTYDLLERLIDLGLITHSIKDKKKYFRAVDPKELLRMIDERKDSILEIMPKLQEMQKTKGAKRPKVTIYEGKEGMKTSMNDMLKLNIREFLSFGSSRSSYELIPIFMEHWHQERIKKGIKMKIIYNNTKATREKLEKFTKSLTNTEYRLMPIEFSAPVSTIIYGNKVVFQNWTKEPFAVMIENDEMSENYKRYFLELWKVAKKK